ncbi:hypothetical protein [Crenobacter luteus]|uniref:hypothetical protein n=1 Tax=Crenobacter luteus TaxID=1452487 RepID=UPI00104E84FE|nr:hypothetical protein [Crenobacter luteus]
MRGTIFLILAALVAGQGGVAAGPPEVPVRVVKRPVSIHRTHAGRASEQHKGKDEVVKKAASASR